jgi:microcystin-dependent protein
MSNCSNCYNGCTEIVSDQCVRYTGLDVPVLGIKTGDSLSYVEQALITFLTSTLDGTGIVITIPPASYCALVNSFLPTCGDITAVALFEALIKSACSLQTQVNAVAADIAILNADYSVGCLTGVTSSSDTHAVVQAIITKLCQIDVSLTALALNVSTNYVKLSDLDALIQAYINGTTTSTQYYTRMVPYTVVEYYGSLSYFNSTGVGNPLLGFEDIYLCNGLNGTPDKRGRVPVGAIQLVPGGTPDPAVNPASDPLFNYNYAVGNTYGANSITLSGTQIPAHTHSVGTTISPNPHSHGYITGQNPGVGWSGDNDYGNLGPVNAITDPVTLTATSTATSFGGGLAHSNAQPALACYYIMYIPTP